MLREHALLRLVLDVMEQAHPARHAVDSDNNGDLSPTRAAVELGSTRGYSLYADRLRQLATPIKEITPLPTPTYQDETKKYLPT
jgi:hypothetical protein